MYQFHPVVAAQTFLQFLVQISSFGMSIGNEGLHYCKVLAHRCLEESARVGKANREVADVRFVAAFLWEGEGICPAVPVNEIDTALGAALDIVTAALRRPVADLEGRFSPEVAIVERRWDALLLFAAAKMFLEEEICLENLVILNKLCVLFGIARHELGHSLEESAKIRASHTALWVVVVPDNPCDVIEYLASDLLAVYFFGKIIAR